MKTRIDGLKRVAKQALCSLGLVGTALLYNTAAEAKVFELPVKKAVLTAAFNTALAGTQLHLQSYGPKNDESYHKTNASWLRLINGNQIAFDVPELSHKGKAGLRWWFANVNDMNTSSIQAYVAGDRIGLSIGFESQGDEVIVQCLKKGFKWNRWEKGCAGFMEPNMHINNALVDVQFVPTAHLGSISFAANPVVDFKADIKMEGLCGKLDGLCDHFSHYKSKVRDGIGAALQRELNRPAIRDSVASSVKKALFNQQVLKIGWTVKSITTRGDSFVFTIDAPGA